jgi:hypothetical protein
MQPFDISSVALDLPDWAYVLPSPTPENIQDTAPAATQTSAIPQIIEQATAAIVVVVVLAAIISTLMLTRKRRSSN